MCGTDCSNKYRVEALVMGTELTSRVCRLWHCLRMDGSFLEFPVHDIFRHKVVRDVKVVLSRISNPLLKAYVS